MRSRSTRARSRTRAGSIATRCCAPAAARPPPTSSSFLPSWRSGAGSATCGWGSKSERAAVSAAPQHAAIAAEIATRIAKSAGELLLRHFEDDSLASDWKEDYSIVTEADVAADRLIAEGLAAEFPNDAVLSEELAPTSSSASHHTWI